MWSQYEVYYIYDEPVPYKDLLIYPVCMKEYFQFHYFASCLLIDKNSIPDINVISMSYLEYLYYATKNEDAPYVAFFDQLLQICLRDNNLKSTYRMDENRKPVFDINGTTYDSQDFDEIKKIIIEQNSLEPPDETIQKEIRDELEKAQEYKNKLSKNKLASLEEQLICVLISTPLSLQEIYELTIRKFSKILRRVDHKLHYQIYLSASMSGMVEFKDKSFIKHWMVDLDIDNDKYKNLMIGVDEVKDKLNFNDLKKNN